MAERIPSFTIEKHRVAKYPWSEWMDGSIWRIKQGEDFESKAISMVGTMYGKAKRNGYKLSVAHNGTTVEFRFKRKARAGVTAVED